MQFDCNGFKAPKSNYYSAKKSAGKNEQPGLKGLSRAQTIGFEAVWSNGKSRLNNPVCWLNPEKYRRIWDKQLGLRGQTIGFEAGRNRQRKTSVGSKRPQTGESAESVHRDNRPHKNA